MHEAGISRGILNIVEDAAEKNNLVEILKIVLEIGNFSGVQIDALEFSFNVLRKRTILKDAEIEYIASPLLLVCDECDTEYISDLVDMSCPVCGESTFQVLHGNEVLVKSIVGR
jgi:hydrogenase nickel incorporation protein HypA/HybF